MNLVTVANDQFRLNAVNLIESFRRFSSDGLVILCYFGDMKPRFLDALRGRHVILRKVEEVCPHAHNPRFFFFKTFALHVAKEIGHAFLYLDAASAVLGPLDHLKGLLEERQRVFVQYPRFGFYKNARWTTAKCFKEMGCDDDRFKEAHQYEGGFQAYLPTEENWRHIDEMYKLMQNPDIAGPSNWDKNPDGNNICQQHRNEQSVLSILIERNGWHQPYDRNHFVQYGDVPTVRRFSPEFLTGTEDVQPITPARYNKLDFVSKELELDLEGAQR